MTIALYVAVMVALVVAVDVAFLQGHFAERLLINIGIVAVFAAFYLGVVRRRQA